MPLLLPWGFRSPLPLRQIRIKSFKAEFSFRSPWTVSSRTCMEPEDEDAEIVAGGLPNIRADENDNDDDDDDDDEAPRSPCIFIAV